MMVMATPAAARGLLALAALPAPGRLAKAFCAALRSPADKAVIRSLTLCCRCCEPVAPVLWVLATEFELLMLMPMSISRRIDLTSRPADAA